MKKIREKKRRWERRVSGRAEITGERRERFSLPLSRERSGGFFWPKI